MEAVMLRNLLVLAILAAFTCAAPGAQGQDGRLTTKQSAHDVAATVERLVAAIEKRGAKVVAKVDHAAAAAGVGLELRPTTVVIFGNPRLGTPLMQENQQVGLDLPLRVLVWQDAAGKVQIGYRTPDRLAAEHGVTGQGDLRKTMAGALAAITDEAAGP
jgi:uncharacterized protein (DUF302 family)